MSQSYRWIVTIPARLTSHAPYAREVITDGPNPDDAITKGLKMVRDADNDLWQRDKLTVVVERVR